MNGMERVRFIVLILVAVVLATMAYSIWSERREIEAKVLKFRAESESVERENRELSASIEYFKIPENLLKESRSQFNYVIPGEKLMILVPPAEQRGE